MPEHLFLHELIFKKPAGTSRGVLHTKPSWIFNYELPSGAHVQTEFPIIPGLSPEYSDHQQYESKLLEFLAEVRPFIMEWSQSDFFTNPSFSAAMVKWSGFPSFIFGLEVLLLGIRAPEKNILYFHSLILVSVSPNTDSNNTFAIFKSFVILKFRIIVFEKIFLKISILFACVLSMNPYQKALTYI